MLKLDSTIAVPVSAVVQEGVAISDINERILKSGRIRLRDRQTLILTGVIQEDDRRLARKWPLLGDLPLIGQLFPVPPTLVLKMSLSSSSRLQFWMTRMLVPMVIGYKPGTEEAKRLIGADSSS